MKNISNRSKSVWSYIGLFMVAMIWGFAFVVVKESLNYVPPTYMIAFRYSIAFVGMLLICIPKLKKMNKRTFIHGIIPGVFLFVAYEVQTIGCKYTTAGKNAFLTALYIIIVPFLSWIFVKKRPKVRVFVAAIIALTGIGLISLSNDFSIGFGDLMTIICAVFFSLQIIALDIFVKNDDPVIICMIEMGVCAVLGWILSPIADGAFPVRAVKLPSVWFGMLFLGIMSTMVCQMLQSVCQKYTKPEKASLIMSMESLFGALGSIIFLGEVFTAKVLCGCVLMVIAIVLAQARFSKHEK